MFRYGVLGVFGAEPEETGAASLLGRIGCGPPVVAKSLRLNSVPACMEGIID